MSVVRRTKLSLNLAGYQWRIQDFPLGGAEPLGGANLRCGCFLAKTYAKMKELDPIGGRTLVAPPGSANRYH